MATTKRPTWMGRPSATVKTAKALAIVFLIAIVVVPFWVVLATSFASNDDVTGNGGYVLWPMHPTTEAYQQVFTNGIVTKALIVSAAVTLLGTAISLAATVLLAYALARPGVYGGKPAMLFILFTFLVPPGIIPAYLVVQNLGLLDSYGSLVLPVLVNAFNVVIMRGFFQGIPEDLYSAARLDGAGEWRILTRVVLPLSKAVVAVVGLFYAVGYWNAFFNAILYLNDSSRWPLQAVLRLYVIQGAQLGDNTSDAGASIAPQSIQMAAVVVATVPILCVYPFLQRYFVKGVLTGAVKS
ncbi:ABC transporter permease [Longispora fulva]|uniref:ABC-type glycerol-3-phosphate transport system permease component n=1 Tax=Longispora fulva TaxID=619741 RepID=A0A8J7GNH9_9ACTN|nr:carbohydrate ABC transporter permease [Longispora fulva]MBG6133846.1 ABC-type glycerol-3-phosphate transport system permease component [Longispora fulva]GIG62885.1 ABC transporter permease [Longispora fulva]